MDKDFYPHAEKREQENIAKLPAFTNRIESLAPGGRLVFLLGVGGTVFSAVADESLCPKVFNVHANYEFGGRSYDENNTIDIRPMLHSSVVSDPIADEVKRLRESLEKLLKQRVQ
jgi:hypothetical protein